MGYRWRDIFHPTRLQKGDLDNKHRGKALKYCELLLAANPYRTFVLCVLTNTVDLELYEVTRPTAMEGQNRAERSSVVTMVGTFLSPSSINGVYAPCLSSMWPQAESPFDPTQNWVGLTCVVCC